MPRQIAKRSTLEWVEHVLCQFNDHRLSEWDACELLGIKRVQLYELRRRWLKAQIAKKPFHLVSSGGHRKRSPAQEVQDILHQELLYIRKKARDFREKFNFSYLAERITKHFGLLIHRNTIRRFAIQHGYYRQIARGRQKVRIRFEMDAVGALFRHDTSRHVWLPVSRRYHDLLLTQDDHSRLVAGFSLREVESSWEHISLARRVFETYGCPLAFYVDRHSIFKFNLGSTCIHYTRRITEEEGKIQFKRILNAVDVAVLYAEDAQSKGKIEKRFDYFQRRLPLECERYRVKIVKDALPILEDLDGYCNFQRVHQETDEIPYERWKRALRDERTKLRPLPRHQDLDAIFSLRFPRTVYSDGTIKFQGQTYKIHQTPGTIVTVAFLPKEKIMAWSMVRRSGSATLKGSDESPRYVRFFVP